MGCSDELESHELALWLHFPEVFFVVGQSFVAFKVMLVKQ